jgi:anti-sigma factor RsiW
MTFKVTELEAYLEEALPADEMSRIEEALRGDPTLARKLSAINARRDAGLHTLGEIWRRHRLSCPTREQLGSFLLGVLDEGEAAYVTTHLELTACRWCQANVEDLKADEKESVGASRGRRRKYFESSAGYLSRVDRRK